MAMDFLRSESCCQTQNKARTHMHTQNKEHTQMHTPRNQGPHARAQTHIIHTHTHTHTHVYIHTHDAQSTAPDVHPVRSDDNRFNMHAKPFTIRKKCGNKTNK